jgi:uncharacterized protein DUF4434
VKPVAAVVALALAGVAPAAAAEARLQGTFLQLTAAHGRWARPQWESLFADLKALGLRRLVVQWTVHDDTAFYPSAVHRSVPSPPLPLLLELADRDRVEVVLGLASDSRWWEAIARDARLVEVYLRRLRLRSEGVARELAPLVRGHASFAGWYLPEEVDDVTWLGPERRHLLAGHLRDLAASLKRATPGATVTVSSFSGAHCDPEALESFWKALLAEAPLDVVLFQDGVGALKMDLVHLPLYLSAMQRAVEGSGRSLGVVVELFEQVGGPPLDHGPFKAVPAPAARVMQQLVLAAGRGRAGAIAFAVPDYMRADSGPRAAQLLEDYLALQNGHRP